MRRHAAVKKEALAVRLPLFYSSLWPSLRKWLLPKASLNKLHYYLSIFSSYFAAYRWITESKRRDRDGRQRVYGVRRIIPLFALPDVVPAQDLYYLNLCILFILCWRSITMDKVQLPTLYDLKICFASLPLMVPCHERREFSFLRFRQFSVAVPMCFHGLLLYGSLLLRHTVYSGICQWFLFYWLPGLDTCSLGDYWLL